jgi:hypothetical protein
MRNKGFRTKLIMVFAVVTGTAILGVCLWPNESRVVTRRNYNKIRIGMPRAEVAAIMGSDGEDLAPLTYEDVVFEEDLSLALRSGLKTASWFDKTHMISVIYDTDGAVLFKYYKRAKDVNQFQRILDWIGL